MAADHHHDHNAGGHHHHHHHHHGAHDHHGHEHSFVLCGYCGYDILAILAVAAFLVQFLCLGRSRNRRSSLAQDAEPPRYMAGLRLMVVIRGNGCAAANLTSSFLSLVLCQSTWPDLGRGFAAGGRVRLQERPVVLAGQPNGRVVEVRCASHAREVRPPMLLRWCQFLSFIEVCSAAATCSDLPSLTQRERRYAPNIQPNKLQNVEHDDMRSVAPNLLTLIGAFPLLPMTFACLYYAPTLTEECPTWVYVGCFVAQFFYQTMDAVDGKHARNTGASSCVLCRVGSVG